MKLLLDVHVPQSWIGELAACGWEAVAWVTVGDPCASDLEILTYARANRFVVVSQDLDFGGLMAASGATSPSLVQLRVTDIRPRGLATHVCAALKRYEGELEEGAVVTVHALRHRVRMLPLLGAIDR